MISHGSYNNTLDSLMTEVQDVDIAAYYLQELSGIPDVIHSPLRRDEHPSFSVYSPDGVKVKYFDFATREQGGMIDLVMNMFGLSFKEAIEKIDKDIVRRCGTSVKVTKGENKITIKSGSRDIQIRTKRRDWKDWDFEYWNSYGIPKNWLLHADIYPVSFIFIISETGYIKTIKADKYAYTFVERKDGIITEKVYQPYNKEGFKWRSGHDSSVWDLWTKLPEKGERVIITSSRKDALCIWAQTRIPSVSLQSENARIKPQVMQELKERFDEVYVLYDNDMQNEQNNGRIDGEKIASEFGIIQIEIPDSYGCKDISDLYHKYKNDIVKTVLTQLLNYAKTNHCL